ncbi:hypothetical protein B0H13DRAFT_2367549 [Mycena leptocephala]|nr:hypothetical protein B0H13DRAFT_2367549 [Mycena leptocephala]
MDVGPHTLLALHGSARVYRCRVTSAMGTTSTVPTPCLPLPTAATRACTCQCDGRGIRIRQTVLHSRSALYDDRQRGYDERGYGKEVAWGARKRCTSAVARGLSRYTEGEEGSTPKCSPQYFDVPVPVQRVASVHPARAFTLGLV